MYFSVFPTGFTNQAFYWIVPGVK